MCVGALQAGASVLLACAGLPSRMATRACRETWEGHRCMRRVMKYWRMCIQCVPLSYVVYTLAWSVPHVEAWASRGNVGIEKRLGKGLLPTCHVKQRGRSLIRWVFELSVAARQVRDRPESKAIGSTVTSIVARQAERGETSALCNGRNARRRNDRAVGGVACLVRLAPPFISRSHQGASYAATSWYSL